MDRGQAAKDLLEHPLLKEALADIRETITRTWEESSDAQLREELWYSLKAANRLEMYLTTILDNQKLDLAKERL